MRREAYKIADRTAVDAISLDRWKAMVREADSWLWLAWTLSEGVGKWKAAAVAKEQQVAETQGRRFYRISQKSRIEKYMKALWETVPQKISRHLAKLTLTIPTRTHTPNIALAPAPPVAVAAWGAALLLDGSAAYTASGLSFAHFFGKCGNPECAVWFFRPGGRGLRRSHCGKKECEDKLEDKRKRERRAAERRT